MIHDTHDPTPTGAQPVDRRIFAQQLAVLAAGALGTPALAHAMRPAPAPTPRDVQQQDAMTRFVEELANGDAAERARIVPTVPRRIAMLAYPGMYPLDLLAPKTVFGDLLQTRVHLVGKTTAPVGAGSGVTVTPDVTYDTCPDDLDVLFVPGGGFGTVAMMRDAATLAFLRARAERAKWVTSVCTGALVLGAAGLLRGYRATTHWVTHDVLREVGATPVKARLVIDRNRITGGGVTAGIDLALLIAAQLAGETYAKAEQLNIEYDPAPPFQAGSPEGAGARITGALTRMYGDIVAAARTAARASAG